MKRLLMILLCITALLLFSTACTQLPATIQGNDMEEISSPDTPSDVAPESTDTEPQPSSVAPDVPPEQSEAEPAEDEPASEEEAEDPLPAEEPEDPEEAEAPEETPSESPELDWADIYTTFLKDNYDALIPFVAGIGFIDLDLDAVPEMVLFDPGASASMGVQFFDIVGSSRSVECVSASSLIIGNAFGGGNYSSVYVNANLFEDFRLMQGPDNTLSFWVTSANGAIDFSYAELIRFSGIPQSGGEGSILTLSSEYYRYEEYDMDTGEVLSSRFEQAGTPISEEEYDALVSAYEADYADTGYLGNGVYIWANSSYSESLDGFLSMIQTAVAAYSPLAG